MNINGVTCQLASPKTAKRTAIYGNHATPSRLRERKLSWFVDKPLTTVFEKLDAGRTLTLSGREREIAFQRNN